jgi:hypothetical protein
MPLPRTLAIPLRSLLALALAVLAIPAVNLAGGWLSTRLFALPRGGDLRLAVDLFWVFMAGLAGTWLMVRVAAVAKTAHAWALFALYLAVDLMAAQAGWDDYPRWFTFGVLLTLPLQVWLGWWLAWGRRRERRR